MMSAVYRASIGQSTVRQSSGPCCEGQFIGRHCRWTGSLHLPWVSCRTERAANHSTIGVRYGRQPSTRVIALTIESSSDNTPACLMMLSIRDGRPTSFRTGWQTPEQILPSRTDRSCVARDIPNVRDIMQDHPGTIDAWQQRTSVLARTCVTAHKIDCYFGMCLPPLASHAEAGSHDSDSHTKSTE
jgi:hypothetical protein